MFGTANRFSWPDVDEIDRSATVDAGDKAEAATRRGARACRRSFVPSLEHKQRKLARQAVGEHRAILSLGKVCTAAFGFESSTPPSAS
jgi:hypothetical protein